MSIVAVRDYATLLMKIRAWLRYLRNLAEMLERTEKIMSTVLSIIAVQDFVFWPTSVEIDKEDEILVLSFEQSLPVGEALLSLDFQGNLNDSMKGLYRSSYLKDGLKHYMAVTQFEPADARRCFPCWDEPAIKATFKMIVQAPIDRVVLSNMPVETEEVSGTSKRVSFQVSPRMSTYLVALVVGELEYLESETPTGNKVRVYCEVGKAEQGKFALDVATKTLPFYEEYFGTPYPLPKMDMVAIPDFAAGAMENYGLVTYRESALLYDEKNSAAANKQRVAVVVAHELAHQWFGNLVTMEWWTHLWLNEGFATWVSFLAVDYLFPDWNIWTQFIDQTVTAFKLDGLVESHPIEVEVGHAREIDEIFDAISYNKGASIIRMLQTYLGAEVFQKGLMAYIKKYAYKNARTEDLWLSLSEASGEPVRELMDSWTKQKGYPVLVVKLKGSSLEVEQSQYLSSGVSGSGEWVVPVTICFGLYSSVARYLVRGKVFNIPLPPPYASEDGLRLKEITDEKPSSNWIKINVGQASFYRVQYDEGLAARLRTAIASGSLKATDRFGILDDTYALCSACKQPLACLLSLMDVFREETDYTVLGSLINIAYKILLVISDAVPEAIPDIKRFSGNLLQYTAEKLGWDVKERETHLDAMLRGEVLAALIAFDYEEVVAEATRRFDAFLQDRGTPLLPADIRSAAFKAVMRRSTSADRRGYDALLQVYREASISQEKTRVLTNLASSPDPVLVKEALDFSISSEVRNQDTFFVFSGISLEGRETAWIWLKEHWSFIWKNWGGFLITRFITATTSQFSSLEKAKDIESFFSNHGNPAIERSVNQSIERVKITAQWADHLRTEPGLVDFIRELSYRSY
ncbi:hypothetical protein GOP47_0028438 [Adiantum capillus-veneris]|nr:hypothetical protein GOP47_0028438 [Adiantum capillus-veneris]